MYDVPADGSCLFWSVATAYLLPVIDNDEEFRARFIQLFNESWLDKLPHIQKLLQNYNLENNYNNQSWYQDETAQRLVQTLFRNRVVDYMRSRLDTFTTRDSELTFRDLIRIERNDANIDNYLQGMRELSTWGGTPEIAAISNFLNSNIIVNNGGSYRPVNQNASNNIQIFNVDGNHYNFALPKNPSQSTTDTSTSVNKTINTNIENLQTTTKKAINKYNALSKEEKQQKLNEINNHFQSLSENDKKIFKDKLKTIGTSAIGAAIIPAGAKITVSGSVSGGAIGSTGESIEMTPLLS
ncbi:OTU domain-containing protein [Spiroplasma endosymbiont of Polydrusus pterygomalis]|uniref:OTU domain-containing protein n=1 Tax=Spiroplasma endosymbiont of Polydrusus pterygomalis TaxID=3139327 RepID=UPI003CCB6083